MITVRQADCDVHEAHEPAVPVVLKDWLDELEADERQSKRARTQAAPQSAEGPSVERHDHEDPLIEFLREILGDAGELEEMVREGEDDLDREQVEADDRDHEDTDESEPDALPEPEDADVEALLAHLG